MVDTRSIENAYRMDMEQIALNIQRLGARAEVPDYATDFRENLLPIIAKIAETAGAKQVAAILESVGDHLGDFDDRLSALEEAASDSEEGLSPETAAELVGHVEALWGCLVSAGGGDPEAVDRARPMREALLAKIDELRDDDDGGDA